MVRELQRILMAGFFLGVVLGWTDAKAQALSDPPGVRVGAGDSIPSADYNTAITEQGDAHYCGSGRCDKPPALIHAVAPRYPKRAAREGRTGMATVVFDIEPSGKTSNVELESATHQDFGDAALKAAGSWKFSPATLDGQPVRFERLRVELPFRF